MAIISSLAFTTRHLLMSLAALLYLLSQLSQPTPCPVASQWQPMAFSQKTRLTCSAFLKQQHMPPPFSPSASLWGKCQLIKGYMVDLSHPPPGPAPLDPPKHSRAEFRATCCLQECAEETHKCTHPHRHTGQRGLWNAKYCWAPTGQWTQLEETLAV